MRTPHEPAAAPASRETTSRPRPTTARIGIRSRITGRLVAVLAATALSAGTAVVAPPAAQAGPDDGKVLTSNHHIDTPKTFWKDGGFVLENEHAGQLTPVEDTVNWVGKGWSGYSDAKNQYQFTVPDSTSLSHMGRPGDVWYNSPSLPLGNHDPNWTGFGADSDIPAEKFRDGVFFLDLMDVKGPGRMEMFNYPSFEYPDDVSNLLSSSRPNWHTALLHPGSHTHNETAFSRPGRYELTYRTVARTTDGKTVQSQPTTQVWQVGGAQPKQQKTPDTRARFDRAPQGDAASAGYSLFVAPKRDLKKDGDENLSTIAFDAKDKNVNGTLTLYDQGYFLTDLDVKNGRADWDEMLGSSASDLQAVFTPADGSSSPRWISQPLHHTGLESSERTTSQAGQGQWPQATPDPANQALDVGNYTPKRTGYTVRVEPTGVKGTSKVTLHFDDPKVRGQMTGGVFDDAKSSVPYQGFDDIGLGPGDSAAYIDNETFQGMEIRPTFLPHADMDIQGFSLSLPQKVEEGKTYQYHGSFTIAKGGPSTPKRIDAAHPDRPGKPAPSNPADPGKTTPKPDNGHCLAPELKDKIALRQGHVDIEGSLKDQGGQPSLGIGIKDETATVDRKTVVRSLDDVVLAAGDQTRHQRTHESLLDPRLDFLGKKGSTFWALPQTQQTGIIWPGYDTQQMDYSKLKDGAHLHLDPESVPEGAQYGIYTDQFNGVDVLTDSTKDDHTIDVGFATHAHANWAFTKPGKYVFDASYSATTKDGHKIESPHQKLTLLIGKEGLKDCDGSGGQGKTGDGSGKSGNSDGGKIEGGGGNRGHGSGGTGTGSAGGSAGASSTGSTKNGTGDAEPRRQGSASGADAGATSNRLGPSVGRSGGETSTGAATSLSALGLGSTSGAREGLASGDASAPRAGKNLLAADTSRAASTSSSGLEAASGSVTESGSGSGSGGELYTPAASSEDAALSEGTGATDSGSSSEEGSSTAAPRKQSEGRRGSGRGVHALKYGTDEHRKEAPSAQAHGKPAEELSSTGDPNTLMKAAALCMLLIGLTLMATTVIQRRRKE